MTGVLSISIVS